MSEVSYLKLHNFYVTKKYITFDFTKMFKASAYTNFIYLNQDIHFLFVTALTLAKLCLLNEATNAIVMISSSYNL